MKEGPLHNRSTFWYIVITIFAGIVIGMAVPFIVRYVDSLSPGSKTRTTEESKSPSETKSRPEGPSAAAPEERKVSATREERVQPQGSQLPASPSEQKSHESIWHAAEAWTSAVQSGNMDSYKEFYAPRLTRFIAKEMCQSRRLFD
jgi:hypothetical protein